MVKSGPKHCVVPVWQHGGLYTGSACEEVGGQQEASAVSGQGLDQEEIRCMCLDVHETVQPQDG